MQQTIQYLFFKSAKRNTLLIPLVGATVHAGFPSPALDFSERSIDLNEELIKHPSTTFFCKVEGDCLRDIGITENDLLIIDKSIEPHTGHVVICYLDGEFVVRVLEKNESSCVLHPRNGAYKPITITEENDFLIWGVVRNAIKDYLCSRW